jgi:hypothetical protein
MFRESQPDHSGENALLYRTTYPRFYPTGYPLPVGFKRSQKQMPEPADYQTGDSVGTTGLAAEGGTGGRAWDTDPRDPGSAAYG